jgi:hypothetical protein
MLATAERRRQVVARSHGVAWVVVHEVVYVPGFGGTHITFGITSDSGRIEFRNHRGRAHRPAKTVLRAISEHPTWFFIGLEFGA